MAEDPIKINVPSSGMKMVNPSQLKDMNYSLLLNGNLQSISDTFAYVTNEASNILCSRFKSGFKVINIQPVISLNLNFFFLVNPATNESEIGIIYNQFNKDTPDGELKCKNCSKESIEDTPLEEIEQIATCIYTTWVNADCLSFNIDKPVKSWVKVDDCNIRIYFTDDNEVIRYIDYSDYQKITIDGCPKSETSEIDCDKIKVFKSTCYPKITFTDVVSGGENTAGVYQFLTAYSDAYGNPITSYYYATNPINLFDKSKTITVNTDYPVSKSIKIHIDDLNTDFDWINIVVLKTVNLTTTAYLLGTFSNSHTSFDYTFSGINLKQNKVLEEILAIKPVYEKANIIANSNGTLIFADLTEARILNLQPYINKLKLQWQTVELNEGDYSNPIIAEKYKSELRDEVVSYAIEFWRTNGIKTARFHIPGREATPDDLIDVSQINGRPNQDVFSNNACDTPSGAVPKWKVYNMASVSGYACGYLPSVDECDRTTIATVYCEGSVFYQDPSSGDYYKNYNPSDNSYSNPISNPCTNSEFTCNSDNCKDSIEEQYGNAPTFISCDVNIKSYGISKIIYTYDETGGTIPIPSYPSSGLAAPTNTTCETAILPTNCAEPTLVQLLDDEGGTQTLYYKFYASSNVQAITVTSVYNQTDNNDFVLTLYESSNGYCDGVNPTPITTITQATPYFFLDNLTPFKTYFFTLTGVANINEGVNDFYYICQSLPTPVSSQTITTANTVVTKCKFEVEYCINYNPCVGIPYQYGDFAYWESTDTYPCNVEVWGDLAGKPIRHHKYPDCLISPHFRNLNHQEVDSTMSNYPGSVVSLFKERVKIYPISAVVDVEQIKDLLLQAQQDGYLTEEERLSICGYRIVRGNRRGNESVVSKGLLYDVWKYTDNVYKSGSDVLYPNYPYNSRQDDSFNLETKLENVNSQVKPIEHPFKTQGYINDRYTFMGANTLFNNPGIGTELKLELEHYGISEGKYTEAVNHPKYQYAGIGAVRAAFCLAALESTFDTIATLNSGGIISAAVLSSIASMLWGSKIPPNYYDWLDVIKKLAPFKNFAWYFNSVGNYSDFVQKDEANNKIIEGNTRRFINSGQYLNQGIQTVQSNADRFKLNNYKRETAIYLNISNTFNSTYISDSSRWFPGDNNQGGTCQNPIIGNVYSPISSFYSSIKNYLPNQYGQIDQIDYIDTGYNGTIDWTKTQNTTCDPVFGGDTFINRFSVRRQLPFFINDVIGNQPNTDVQYNELANIGYPHFFFSYPHGNILTTQSINQAVSSLYGDVVLNNTSRRDYSFNCDESSGQGIFAMSLQALGLSQSILSANAISSIGALATQASMVATFDLSNNPVFPAGRFFLYSYGVPSFMTESNYNLDLRYGTNQTFGNFYPNISDIPTWTQPTAQFNLINYDNTYFYNLDYSKQNHENNGYVLNPDFDQSKEDCKTNHSNRAIYSLPDNDNNDRFDGNSVFLANNYKDFPKEGGKLSFIKGVENNKILVVQENIARVYNAYNTVDTNGKGIYIGSGTLFNDQAQLFVKTDLGYGGSQTQANITTEYGTFWVDNLRGQILKYGESIENIISEENTWWFKENLPFQILKYFPEADISNPYKYFGMLITYDQRFKRILITKKDYKPLSEFKDRITLKNNEFYLDTNKLIYPTDPTYFCNQSWTIGYSPIFKEFISFYSFTPNYYSSNNAYFSSGVNFSNDQSEIGLWNHNLTNKSFQVFYGKIHPFSLQYSQNQLSNSILESIRYEVEFRRYTDGINYALNNNVTYNKATIFNQNQSTGLLELIPKQKNNLFQISQYPKQTPNSLQILTENTENFWSFNNFHNIAQNNGFPIMFYNCNPAISEINPKAISNSLIFFKNKLRSDYFNIRLTNDKLSNYMIAHKLSLSKLTPSQS